eukprot:696113-Prorocentrum_minimum.AAC.1
MPHAHSSVCWPCGAAPGGITPKTTIQYQPVSGRPQARPRGAFRWQGQATHPRSYGELGNARG